MQYTDELLKKIVMVGTLGYAVEKIINVLDIEEADEADFIKAFATPGSPVFKAYKKGIDKADFAIDLKLFELAKSGDLNALKEYEKRKTEQQFQQMKKEILNGKQ